MIFISSLLTVMATCTYHNTIRKVKHMKYHCLHEIEPTSMSGHSLIHKASLHVADAIFSMHTLPCNSDNGDSQSCVVLGVSSKGTIFTVTPVEEAVFRRMGIVQGQTLNSVEPFAALNPRTFRNCPSYAQSSSTRAILDGVVLSRFTQLSLKRQNEIARKARTTREQIIEDLIRLHSSLSCF